MKKKIDTIHEMRKRFEYIISVVARKGITISYTRLGEIAKFPLENLQDYQKMNRFLIPIDQEAYPKKGILPSAVIVRKCCGVPGRGFYKNAMKMNIDIGFSEIIFYAKELEKVFKYYAK